MTKEVALPAQLLLEADRGAATQRMPPLGYATALCDEEMALAVLERAHGADAQAAPLDVDALGDSDVSAFTPLHLACEHGHAALVRALLHPRSARARAASVTATTNALTLQSGEVTPAGQTALHLAARRGDVAISRMLLGAGADPLARDAAGATPLEIAEGSGGLELVESLRAAAGARSATPTDPAVERTRATTRVVVPRHLGAPYVLEAVFSAAECARMLAAVTLHCEAAAEVRGPRRARAPHTA